jgi:tungstate transport system substrate-binding protein
MGRKGEADVLLVHSPEDEKKLVSEGYAIDREPVMHNDFLVVGPPADPAKVKGSASATTAFGRIAAARALFVSRGDNSGTHARELKLWQAANIRTEGQKWYQQTGLGMGDTLNVASEKGGYTLTDRGTFVALNQKKRLALDPLLVGDASLINVYHVMVVNPARWPKANAAGARAFAAFLVSPETQAAIGKFGVEQYGEALFFPDAPAPEPATPPRKASRPHRGRAAP